MKPLIVALDVETDKEALQMTRHLVPWVNVFKVGPVLFLRYGGPFLRQLRALGADIFLDLKFHDIPSVVRKAVERAGEWGVYSATLHTSGGFEMMRQAASVSKRPKLWGVTVLTSLDKNDLKRLGIARSVQAQVNELARQAKKAGLDGVVASVREVSGIKKVCGKSFTVVTPGIRPQSGGDDQKRAETPAEALRQGSDFLVIGRPIIEAKDPVQAVTKIYKSMR